MERQRVIYDRIDIETVDLRGITRNSKKVTTAVTIFASKYDRRGTLWLQAGETSLRAIEGQFEALNCHLEGATDAEHDSAYAFVLPLIGARLESIYDGRTRVRAWIDPNAGDQDFRVPRAGFNPLMGARRCKECRGENAHVFTDYLPDFDADLFEQVAGKPIEIAIGPIREE